MVCAMRQVEVMPGCIVGVCGGKLSMKLHCRGGRALKDKGIGVQPAGLGWRKHGDMSRRW
jgi:hypothetical protein